jgi:hypothetical protein
MRSSGRLCTGRLHPLLFMLFLLLIARDSAGERAENSRNSMNSKVPGGARPSGTRGHAPAGLLRIEHRVDVARAVQHTDDIDPVDERYEEDNVAPHRKTAHARREFFASAAHHRLRGQHPAVRRGHPPSGRPRRRCRQR